VKEDNFKNARILIVDDERVNTELLESILEAAGYTNLLSTNDPRQVLPLVSKFQPDLILLDLMMPHLDGYSVLQQIGSRIAPGAYLPVLVLTADASREAKQKALSMCAKDFLTKPLESTEVLLRIRNLLETRFLHLRLQEQNRVLEEKVRERTQELHEAHVETVQRLAMASKYHEDHVDRHPRRVGEMSAVLASAIGLDESQVELMRVAATLHDVGNLGIPDSLLRKRGKLTLDEFEQIKAHTTIGGKILSGTKVPLLQLAEEIALYHHERWDGSGYSRLKGEAIPISARIVALADTFDVLTHERPYRPAWPLQEATEEIKRQSGRHLDPRLVEEFLRWRGDQDRPRRMMETVLGG
jgi:putative two-component system response regulator